MAANQFVYFMDGVSKTYPGGKKVFENIRLNFLPGVKIGVVGVNGTGKSTLMRIMAGQDKDFAGEAWAAEGARVGYLPQEPQLDENLTVRENVMLGVADKKAILDRYNEVAMNYSEETADEMAKLQDEIDAQNLWDLDAQIDVSMEALRCPPDDANVATLSGGEKRRVALCKLLLEAPDMLLLDEPTNHLDAETIAWLQQHLIDYKGTILIVTHDRYFLDDITGWILELDRGRGIPNEGNYSDWLDLIREDIENISVLKGAAATAVYGTAGSGGVVLITTKKGAEGQKLQVNVSSQVAFDKISQLISLQDTYAQGRVAAGVPVWRGPETGESGSWGPRLADLEYSTNINDYDDENGNQGAAFDTEGIYRWDNNGFLVPRGQGNGIAANNYNKLNNENFFRTGISLTNNVGISGSNENLTYRFSVSNLKQEGIVMTPVGALNTFKHEFNNIYYNMDILGMLKGQLGEAVISQLGNAIGGSKEQTSAGIDAALPTILGALSRGSQTEGGQNALMSFLDKDGDGDIMDDLQGYIGGGNDTNGGSSIIEQFLGGKKDTVNAAISQNSGLNQEASSNLMTQLAPMVMNMLGKGGKAQGGGLDINSVLGLLQNQGEATKKGGNLGFVANLLDQDGDGSITDDALNIGKSLLGGFFGKK